jgi:hypothetical protein
MGGESLGRFASQVVVAIAAEANCKLWMLPPHVRRMILPGNLGGFPMRHRTKIRMATNAVAALLFTYLLLAYFVVPEIWIFHDADRVAKVGNMVTTTEQGIPGDPINVGLVGSKEEVIRAFAAAGWDPADKITLRTSIDIGLSVVLDRPDLDAPVSPLLFEGRKQDLAFEKPVGKSADERIISALMSTQSETLSSAIFSRPDNFCRAMRSMASDRPKTGATEAAIPISPTERLSSACFETSSTSACCAHCW